MSINCGNCRGKHQSVAEVRSCHGQPVAYQRASDEERSRSTFLRDASDHEEVWPWAAKTPVPAATFRAPAPAYPAKKPMSDRKFKPLGVAYAEALRGGVATATPDYDTREEEATRYAERSTRRNDATEPMMDFIRTLLAERDWQSVNQHSFIAEAAREVNGGLTLSFDDAKRLIPALKELPKVSAPGAPKDRARPEQPWRKLSREVPAGYYAVVREGKNHFFRVSVGRNGFYKIQEQASDELYETKLGAYAGILTEILETGLAEAGRLYATERGKCYRCNRTLTDNTGNPYFAQGLGPECGAK